MVIFWSFLQLFFQNHDWDGNVVLRWSAFFAAYTLPSIILQGKMGPLKMGPKSPQGSFSTSMFGQWVYQPISPSGDLPTRSGYKWHYAAQLLKQTLGHGTALMLWLLVKMRWYWQPQIGCFLSDKHQNLHIWWMRGMTIPLASRKQETLVLPTWPTRGTAPWESWKLRHINSLAFSCLKYFW